MSNVRIKVVSSSSTTKIADSKPSANYKIKPEIKKEVWNIKVGDSVKHKEENILGKVVSMSDTRVVINWNDNTKERIKLEDVVNELDYVDDIETVISPTTTQMPKKVIDEETSLAINKALETLGEDIVDDYIIESAVEQPKEADLEKIKLQRQVNELQNKLNTKTNNNIKDKIAADLVDLAVTKNMIEADDAEFEKQMILSMDDDQIEEYKQKVLSFNVDGEVTSTTEAVEDRSLSEAEKALNKIKGNGGKPIIGDFSKEVPTTVNVGSNYDGERRSLGEIKDNKFSFNNQYTIPSFEDSFVDILSTKVDDSQTNYQPQQTKIAQSKGLPGFENLQGLTKPLVVNKPAMQNPTNSSFQDLFSNLEWTTLGQRK